MDERIGKSKSAGREEHTRKRGTHTHSTPAREARNTPTFQTHEERERDTHCTPARANTERSRGSGAMRAKGVGRREQGEKGEESKGCEQRSTRGEEENKGCEQKRTRDVSRRKHDV